MFNVKFDSPNCIVIDDISMSLFLNLFHDPNIDSSEAQKDIKSPIEGNPRRDLWKRCAFAMADSKSLDDYTRAVAGSLCGNLESLINVCSENWWDLLWAYLKTQIDIRV
jgi:nuclear pore complex protein Nup107